jgi:hypothetical protein
MSRSVFSRVDVVSCLVQAFLEFLSLRLLGQRVESFLPHVSFGFNTELWDPIDTV